MEDAFRLLIEASERLGSIADLARVLHTDPQRVYMWIADRDLPTGEELERLKQELRAIIAAQTRRRRTR